MFYFFSLFQKDRQLMGVECSGKHQWNQNRPEDIIVPKNLYDRSIFPPHSALRLLPKDAPQRIDYLVDLKNNCKQLHEVSRV